MTFLPPIQVFADTRSYEEVLAEWIETIPGMLVDVRTYSAIVNHIERIEQERQQRRDACFLSAEMETMRAYLAQFPDHFHQKNTTCRPN